MTKKSFYSSLFINSGRIIFALPFLGFGINHFIKTEKYVFFMPDYIPFPEYLMYFIGIVFILSAINIIINFKARISALVLAGILALLTIIVYLPDFLHSKTNIGDMAIFIGGALLIAGISKK